MSLTSVLKSDRELSRRLANLLPIDGAPHAGGLATKAPPRTKDYSLVGTAFDYLFRFEVQRRNPSAVTKPWVAETAVNLLRPFDAGDGTLVLELPGVEDPDALANLATAILTAAKAAHQRYLSIRDPTEAQIAEIAPHALRLAKLDVIYRAGIIDPALESAAPLDVQDLVGLWKVIPFDGPLSVCLAENVWLNPTFGRFSTGIQGADADVVASTMLIDIKTSINPNIRQHTAQLVGYAMLADAYRAEEAPEFPPIKSVGIYFARQGALVALSMERARKNPDFGSAFQALMVHCENAPLRQSDVRAMINARMPSGPPKQRPSRKRGG